MFHLTSDGIENVEKEFDKARVRAVHLWILRQMRQMAAETLRQTASVRRRKESVLTELHSHPRRRREIDALLLLLLLHMEMGRPLDLARGSITIYVLSLIHI